MLSFLFFQVRRQLLLYLPDRTTKHNNDFRFVLILVCYSATGLRGTYKLDLLFRNFWFWSITKSEMLRHVSTQCYLRRSYGSDFSSLH